MSYRNVHSRNVITDPSNWRKHFGYGPKNTVTQENLFARFERHPDMSIPGAYHRHQSAMDRAWKSAFPTHAKGVVSKIVLTKENHKKINEKVAKEAAYVREAMAARDARRARAARQAEAIRAARKVTRAAKARA